MRRLIMGYRRDERGASATEYAMLIVFIALAIAVGAQTLGNDLSGLFTRIGDTLVGVNPPTPPAP
jgi:pilus assembly protein Flp/PilA